MSHRENKTFTFSHAPTGEDVATLIWENSLIGWTLDIKARETNPMFSTGFGPTYVYDVVFERTIT